MTASGQVSLPGKLLLAFASTLILGSRPRRTHNHIFMSHNSGSCATTSFLAKSQSSPINCWWPSPAQWFLVSGAVRTHYHIFVFWRLLLVLQWDPLFEEGRGLTSTGHSPFVGGVSPHWLAKLPQRSHYISSAEAAQKHRFQKFLHCRRYVHEPLPSDGSIVYPAVPTQWTMFK
jgi:hypothetical protein